MANNYVFSLHPTFTQGLILGQLSILILLALILKYLFLDSSQDPIESSSYHPSVDTDPSTRAQKPAPLAREELAGAESAGWVNVIAHQVAEAYRSKLRDGLSGPAGDEVARRRIEEYANSVRPPWFLDHIKVHSVNLGSSAPCLSNARLNTPKIDGPHPDVEFDLSYADTISISLSTSYLFNYPMPSFARLPVSLTISLAVFESTMTITPPSPALPAPVLTVSVPPEFTLDLNITSLMGSRAKLANVPKLHELIQHQVHRILAAQGTRHIVLPGLASVAEAKAEIKREEGQFGYS